MHRIAQGIENGADLIIHFRRQMNGVESGDLEIFREGAGHVHAHAFGFRIEMEMPGPRHAAFHADEMAFTGDSVAYFHSAHVRTNFAHHACKFMAHDHGHRNGLLRPLIPFPDVQVSAANAGFRHLDENVIRPDLGHRLIAQHQAFSALGLHQCSHEITFRALPTFLKAAAAASTSPTECAAEICVRMRALP